jgi:type IV secretory pathway VirB2 component (pilin)
MNIAKTIALLGILAMTAVLIFGFTRGDFFAEGSKLFSMPWGIVSLVDLYTGFMLFSGWIIYREKSLALALLWALSVMVLGFFAASLYAFLALQSSGGDWKKFWMGKRA